MYPMPESQLPFVIDTDTPPGWTVWSIQRACNRISYVGLPSGPMVIEEDGVFGPQTVLAVRAVQSLFTFKTLSERTSTQFHRHVVKFFTGDHPLSPAVYRQMYGALPDNLLHSISDGEASYCLACVSRNKDAAGKTTSADCGPFQDSLYPGDFPEQHRVERAFDVRVQAAELAAKLAGHYITYKDQAGTHDGKPGFMSASEKAWRLAALYHNWPAGADRLASTPTSQLSKAWFEDADWVIAIGGSRPVHLPDGYEIRSMYDWARFYSLGFTDHSWPGSVVKHVIDWSPQGDSA